MLSISLSKKTFGIKNKTLLNLAAKFYIATYILILVFAACEPFILYRVVKHENLPDFAENKQLQHPGSFWVTFFHFGGSTLICFLTGLYIQSVDEKLTKKQSFRIGCITILHFLFLFNPWIAKYQIEAEEFYVVLQYTIGLYYILFFCCLAISAFICWLPWQNQSMRKKPKYKVIYGGNDTKKMPVVNDFV